MESRFNPFFLMLAFCMFFLSPLQTHAAPEHIVVKAPDRAVKERTARTALKTVDVRDIEDPAARKAIREIMNYLNLEYKK